MTKLRSLAYNQLEVKAWNIQQHWCTHTPVRGTKNINVHTVEDAGFVQVENNGKKFSIPFPVNGVKLLCILSFSTAFNSLHSKTKHLTY